MLRLVVGQHLKVFAGLWLGCYPLYLPLAGLWAWGPTGLIAGIAALLGWAEWRRGWLPRQPLTDRVQLISALARLAERHSIPFRQVVVVPYASSEFEVPELINLAGEVAYGEDELEEKPLSQLLAIAARQLAVAEAPERYGWAGLLLTGAALGLLAGLQYRFLEWPTIHLIVLAALVGLGVLIAMRSTTQQEERARAIEDRARELLGSLRQEEPDLFADLTARQGLSGEGTGGKTGCH